MKKNDTYDWFLLSPHVVGAGITTKAPPSRVSSEGGGRGVVGRGREETPLRLAFRAREGVMVALEWAGGILYEKKPLNRADKLLKNEETKKKIT